MRHSPLEDGARHMQRTGDTAEERSVVGRARVEHERVGAGEQSEWGQTGELCSRLLEKFSQGLRVAHPLILLRNVDALSSLSFEFSQKCS